MPTYEYECEKCGKHFDLFQRMSDDPITVCPDAQCKGHVKRLIGEGAGIIFKGSGFYCTDYKHSAAPATCSCEHSHSSESSTSKSSSSSSGNSKASEKKS